MTLLFLEYCSPLGLSSLFFYSPFLLLVIVGYILGEVIFNTSFFSGCVFALGSQRESLCERTGL